MRIFVTGASGWIGSAVIPELRARGHQVVGLARSEAAASRLTSLGVEVCRGTLDDHEVLLEAASTSDGVIHLAFMHDVAFSGGYDVAAAADRRAVEIFGEALAGSGRPLLIASGTLGLSPGRLATELDGHGGSGEPTSGPSARLATAEYALGLAERGVRSCVVRLAPTNHGDGDQGFVAWLVQTARARGVAGFVGDGRVRWNAVHRLDTAQLIALALDKAPAGSTLHAVAEEGVPLGDVAAVIGRHLGVPTESVAPQDAFEHFGWLGFAVALDSPVSSARTRELLGWSPTQPGLIDDLEQGHYFAESSPAK